MSTFILIITYFLAFFEIIWYFTCTKHKEVPLVFPLIDTVICCIPGFNIIMVVANVLILWLLVEEEDIELKDNWFNRKFLAYRGE